MTRNRLIDLYSDTATRPTPGMRRAIGEAEVGDEQLGEDPTTTALEERVADLLGKDAAVFLPSGTMCNQIALLVHCRRGDEIIGAEMSHVFTSEAGGAAANAGVQTWPVPSTGGLFTPKEIEEAVRPEGRHSPRSRLLLMEQTVNRGGGAVWPVERIQDVAAAARKHGLLVHMDGARLMNAAVASGASAKAIAQPCDSVWLDLSKGLGCPVGGVLAGSRDFIDEAWQWKHRLGGALRQSGILAAAGIFAIDHHIERLAEDHANAALLAERLQDIPGVKLMTPAPETNIVFFDVAGTGRTPDAAVKALLDHGVRMGTSYGRMIRAVTHLDVSRADIETAASALRSVLS